MIDYLLFKYKIGYINKDEINDFFYILSKLGVFKEDENDRSLDYKKDKLFEKRILIFTIEGKYTINRPLLRKIIHYLKGEKNE